MNASVTGHHPAGSPRLRQRGWMAAVLLAASGGAGAQSMGWEFEFTPYLWGAAMRGDVQAPALPRTSVDMSFGDILDALDFGLMAAFEARKGRWGYCSTRST